jgi:uncharacterized membrane protein
MASVEKSIEVHVPVSTAYNQWTQFESFPQFMDGVKEVRQLDDTHLHWKAEVGGREMEWDAEISEQKPDERIAWHAVGGKGNAGVVSFHRIDDGTTKVMLQLEAQPEALVEKIGDLAGVLDRQVKSDLENFRKFIESRGQETGAWRGQVDRPGDA